MARLVFVNRFYWPEEPATGQLLTDLAEGLAALGHDVSVITSHPKRDGVPSQEQRHGVQIRRVRGTRAHHLGLLGKSADFLTFFLGAMRRVFRQADRNSIVIAMTDPPLLGIGAWIAARLRGARIVHWIQDIYPELAIELAGQRWLQLLKPLRNASWRRADACVTLGQEMAALIAAAGVSSRRLHVSPNWAPAGLVPQNSSDEADALRTAWNLRGKFVVAYSGNLGRVHDLDPVLDVADALRDSPAISFLFIGGGPQRTAIEKEVLRRGLPNVTFQPAQPRHALAAALSVAEVHLVTLRPGCEHLVFPSKLYGITAIGRPVLFIGPTGAEIARIIRENRFGRTAARDEAQSIATCLRELSGNADERARLAAAAEKFAASHTAGIAIARWNSVIAALERAETRPLPA